jgi:5'-nucleotidase
LFRRFWCYPACVALSRARLFRVASWYSSSVPHGETAAAVADVVLPWLAARSHPVALNVNVPNVPLDELRGIARARLASHGEVRASVTERGAGWVQFEYGPIGADHEPGTDVALLADKHACLTPLSVACEATDVGTAALSRVS